MIDTTELVHGRLALWAQTRGDQCAIRSELGGITFAELARQVQDHAESLNRTRAPATVLQDASLPLVQRLVSFLGTIASGRCAAVSDPAWPDAVLDAIRQRLPASPWDSVPPTPLTPFYTGFTSGSTGLPKGFRRHHRSWTESFDLCLRTFGEASATCIFAPGRDSHSLFLFGMLLGLWTGAGVVVQEQFSASAALDTLRQGHTPCLVAVPSQLLMMLEWAQHRRLAPITGVRLVLISGARWSRNRTPELQALFPQARIIEFYGASETSFIAWTESASDLPDNVVGRPFDNVEVEVRGASADSPDGLIYVRSPMVFIDYIGADKDHTAALRDGDWVCVRDLGHVDGAGRLRVAGRESRMLITMAKKLFPEELEAVMEAHPAVARASVHGLPDAKRGLQVVAVVQWATSEAQPISPPDLHSLQTWCRDRLEAFKVPRQIWTYTDWAYTASGKTDHVTLGRAVAATHGHGESSTCLTPLH